MMRSGFIDIHTHRHGNKNAFSVLSFSIGRDLDVPETGMLFSAGIHPWSASGADITTGLEYLRTARVIAIGEIGLDYVSAVDREDQEYVFGQQLKIAEQRDLPVIIHCVKAYNEVLAILKKYKLAAVIFHGYIGSVEQTESILKNRENYFSFGERSLQSPKTVESLSIVPSKRIFIETDESEISIEELYRRVAEIKGMTMEDLKDRIRDNFNTVFDYRI